MIGGIVIPVVDRIGGSTAAYSLKCRFPRETGRSQAPRRQQHLNNNSKFYLNDATHGRKQQLRDLDLANNRLQELYRREEFSRGVQRYLARTKKRSKTTGIHRRNSRYINFKSGTPTTTIDSQILDMLSDSHLVAMEKLKEQMRAHNLEWTRPVNSRLYEGAERDRGAVIARSNSNIISTCWIRRLLKVDGSWKIVEDYCRWIPMYRKTIYCEKQQPSADNFAPICFFFEPVQIVRSLPIIKTWGWARICTDILQFNLFGHLEPVGMRNFCTDIVPVGPVVHTSGVPKRATNNLQYDIRIVDSLSVSSPDHVAKEPVVHIEKNPTDSPLHFTTDDFVRPHANLTGLEHN
ncbi:hypothetical protein F511_19155 [Dorcoceras hygrometricum]|uniref:Uncharacterized protein n=1 Tax=Dorcoceras hygrometricum TaxID=472368 RepID=A0A2Z7A7L2_9LAMI|nr:hypothetical protein F511_19155 [Dorcoceras hygrometricum]